MNLDFERKIKREEAGVSVRARFFMDGWEDRSSGPVRQSDFPEGFLSARLDDL
ncbi:hypothetical protein [Thermodesulforhabdus norvegica]|uniref:hypothetical protein n=1 Tax=Thermodesulforhabdus norvegica TaxID=39841 RepID=UPI0015A5356C|nr:hypothetical protein [Thermodesulforhabdus norvegica]